MPEITLEAKVTPEGALLYDTPARLAGWLQGARGQRVEVTFTRNARRSTKANAYWWGCVLPFCQEVLSQRAGIPLTSQQTHDVICRAFLGTVDVEIGGEIHAIRKSSRKLTVPEFADLTKRVEQWIETEYQVKPSQLMAEEDIP